MPRIDVNGYDLYYADDNFTAPWSYPETVFLQSYVLGNHADWWQWMPILAKDLRVLRLDRRGLGLSQKPTRDYQFKLEDLVSDFDRFLDLLGIDQVHYIGESLGGVIGVAFAALYPDRVKSLVLCHTPTRLNDAVRARWAGTEFPDGPSAVLAQGAWGYSHRRWLGRRTDDIETDLQALWRGEQQALVPAHVQASILRMILDPAFSVEDMLEKVQAPTLLISPSSSATTTPEEQTMICSRIPDCSQVIFERTANMLEGWKDPTECASVALEFVNSQLGSGKGRSA